MDHDEDINHDEDIKIINGFVGRDCERTLACNSIKLRFADKGQANSRNGVKV